MPGTELNRDDEIRQLAYRLWQEAGCPDGNETQHWLTAETIWLGEHRSQSEAKQSKARKSRKPKKTGVTAREL